MFMFDHKKLLCGVLTLLLFTTSFVFSAVKMHEQIKKRNTFVEEKITKQAIRFKKEMKTLKSAFFGLCAIALLSKGYELVNGIRAIFVPENKSTPQSFLYATINSVFRFSYSTIITYVVQKSIQYGINYYLQQHPLLWFLKKRVHIEDHFDSLLCKMANEHKKSPLCRTARIDVKNYILLFTKTIFKDSQKICAFMRYRSTLLPAYKQPTALLIQQNILIFILEWIEYIEISIEQDSAGFDELYSETLRFKKLFFEQIDLFVKIDDEKEFLRDIALSVQSLAK